MNLADVKNIVSGWGLVIQQMESLSERAILVITSQEEKFILKKKSNVDQFNRELMLIHHLKNHGFPTQFPLADQEGKHSVPYGNVHYALYHYLEGTAYTVKEGLNNPAIPKLLGETIARLHQIMQSVDFLSGYPDKNLVKVVYGFAVNEIQKVDDAEALQTIYQSLEGEIKSIVDRLPKHLIHRDAHMRNMIFKHHSLSGVIDYEIAEVNVRIFDLCYCATSVLSEVFMQEELRGKWMDFVEHLAAGYSQIHPLSSDERKAIWYVMLCIQSIFMGYFATDEGIYQTNKEMFLWIFENRRFIEKAVKLNVNEK